MIQVDTQGWNAEVVPDNTVEPGQGRDLDGKQYDDADDHNDQNNDVRVRYVLNCSMDHLIDYNNGQEEESLQQKMTYDGYVNDGTQQEVTDDTQVSVDVGGELVVS